MEITWYGHSCFRLMERGKASIVIDPFDESLGYPVPRLKADIVTTSHDAPGHSNAKAVKNAKHLIDGPGEYEIGGIFITAVATYPPKKVKGEVRRNLVIVFDFDNLTVCHLGDLDHVPQQSLVENLGTIDVALTPVGGGGGLSSAQAAEVISMLEPGIVIPMHYKTPELTLKLDPVDKFLKEMGLGEVAQETSLKISSRSSLPEQTEIVLLEYQNNQ
jgi:L-ascorbate metabolism protein UlaG (beta-lactamase superfamily)